MFNNIQEINPQAFMLKFKPISIHSNSSGFEDCYCIVPVFPENYNFIWYSEIDYSYFPYYTTYSTCFFLVQKKYSFYTCWVKRYQDYSLLWVYFGARLNIRIVC